MATKVNFVCLGFGPGFSCSMFHEQVVSYVCTNIQSACEVQNFQFPFCQYLQAFASVNVGWLERLILKASATLKSKIHVQLWHYLDSSLKQISALLVIFFMSELNISVGWYVGETQEPFFILKNLECFHSLGFGILVARWASTGKSLHVSLISQRNCHTTS